MIYGSYIYTFLGVFRQPYIQLLIYLLQTTLVIFCVLNAHTSFIGALVYYSGYSVCDQYDIALVWKHLSGVQLLNYILVNVEHKYP